MCVCIHSVVSFGHRSAFPVTFDAESVEKWWKSSLVFKVYCKYSTQRVVSTDMIAAFLLALWFAVWLSCGEFRTFFVRF